MSHSEDKYLPPIVVRAIDNISRIKGSSYPIKIPELQAAVYLLLKKRTMGYYTYFSNNDVKLDRSLNEKETVEFDEFVIDFNCGWTLKIEEISGIKETFLCIYDEDEMKGYTWKDELKSILALLDSFGIKVNGSITWDGEESGDVGTCSIVNSEASLSNFANILDIISHLRDAGFDDAAKSIEYHYCEKL